MVAVLLRVAVQRDGAARLAGIAVPAGGLDVVVGGAFAVGVGGVEVEVLGAVVAAVWRELEVSM